MTRDGLLSIALALTLSACGSSQPTANLPSENTEGAPERASVIPESVGVRSGPLADMIEFALGAGKDEVNVHHVTVVRRGQTVLAVDFFPYSADMPHDVASVAKSVTSTLVGMAVDDGFVEGVDAPVLAFFPDQAPAAPSPRWRRMTVRHLLTMTSGLCADFDAGERQLDAMRTAPDAVRFALAQPLVDEPGERWAYCSAASNVLAALVQNAVGEPLQAYAQRRLFGPLGIEDVVWPSLRGGAANGWGDVFFRPADLARIGQLMLAGGAWEGRRLLSASWIEEATRSHVETTASEGYGYRWWVSRDLEGLYEGHGRGGQRLSVWPTGDAVVVMLGSGFEPGDLGGFIVQAIAEAERLPPDPEAFARLQAAVARAAEPPEADPVPPLPDLARVVSGRRFVAEPNDVGVTGFHLDFPGGAEAVFTLGLAVERSDEFADRVSPVGLDGVPRVSDTGRLGLPLAAAGRWDGDTFRVDYDDFANNHRYRLTVRFEDDRAVLTLAEPSTGLEVEVAATAAP